MCSYILAEKFTLTTLSNFYRIRGLPVKLKRKEIGRREEVEKEREGQNIAGKKRKESAKYKESKFERNR